MGRRINDRVEVHPEGGSVTLGCIEPPFFLRHSSACGRPRVTSQSGNRNAFSRLSPGGPGSWPEADAGDRRRSDRNGPVIHSTWDHNRCCHRGVRVRRYSATLFVLGARSSGLLRFRLPDHRSSSAGPLVGRCPICGAQPVGVRGLGRSNHESIVTAGGPQLGGTVWPSGRPTHVWVDILAGPREDPDGLQKQRFGRPIRFESISGWQHAELPPRAVGPKSSPACRCGRSREAGT
jgi:hypothetical protein